MFFDIFLKIMIFDIGLLILTLKSLKTISFSGFEGLGLCSDYRYRRELSIDVLYVTGASIYAELWPKQVLHRKVL